MPPAHKGEGSLFSGVTSTAEARREDQAPSVGGAQPERRQLQDIEVCWRGPWGRAVPGSRTGCRDRCRAPPPTAAPLVTSGGGGHGKGSLAL